MMKSPRQVEIYDICYENISDESVTSYIMSRGRRIIQMGLSPGGTFRWVGYPGMELVGEDFNITPASALQMILYEFRWIGHDYGWYWTEPNRIKTHPPLKMGELMSPSFPFPPPFKGLVNNAKQELSVGEEI